MWIFYSAIQAALDLQRICSKCGTKHVVRPKNKNRISNCNKCGNAISPPRYRT